MFAWCVIEGGMPLEMVSKEQSRVSTLALEQVSALKLALELARVSLAKSNFCRSRK